ncbi:YbaK/EbsC family protein [Clostridium botulinum]|uniref:Putative prolyl-tRNA synthetase n=1 Tax=Clostridium botulinum (strain Langeland / NCTC 10281 / Type F) TaxID=441772 RepID=A7GJ98_CLOBL|nr:YbaK/EbsC family protein [Clostridium botulinum]ABS40186.1 putative prolyl-tRNA synthetase [Clostridium botulinum F str. Langeland]ADG01214.1 putative prolyl-tRNA synthetase [Clostridium botulinum F str. 230613]KKM41910.1 prolyl-tRNA synthetase [Clostridium botulinum]MBY6793771.1 proline--tRNA ligase [Clostridium botulinum]MBY6938902.1 proline--tRNA ligase [Clostridium botulinum]
MKLSKTLVHSLREDPADVEMDSQKLLLKGGLITKVDSGLYAFTPLGYSFLECIQKVVENKSKKIGGSQISIPYVNNFEDVSEKNNDFILNFNEEILMFINFLRNNVTSYKQLPLFFYENNTEFSYKGKNNLGIMSGKQVLREHFYIALDEEKDKFNKKELIKLYKNIFEIMNLQYNMVEDELDGTIKFIIYNNIGDSRIVACKSCNYGNEINRASSIPDYQIEKDLKELNKIETPDIKTIEELGEFFKVPYRKFTKTIIYKCNNDSIVAVMVRGDRDIDEFKVIKNLGNIKSLELAGEDIVRQATDAEIGFAGPINLKVDKILIDEEITKMNNFMVGANETGYHYENVNYGRDFKGIVGEFRKIHKDSKCILCGDKLEVNEGFVIGEIKKIEENLIKNECATFIDNKGKSKLFTIYKGFMDIYKIISWAIEQNKDELGIVWPMETSAFKVIVTIANVKDEQQFKVGEKIYSSLVNIGIGTILDDRKERAGVKFKDADLWGIPIRITVGKNIKENNVEIKLRNSKEKKEIPIDQLQESIKSLLGIG